MIEFEYRGGDYQRMKPVKFLKNFSPYKATDMTALPDAEADDLAKKGIVELYKNGKTEKKAVEEKKEEVKKPEEKKDEGKKTEGATEDSEEKSVDAPMVDKMVKEPVKKK